MSIFEDIRSSSSDISEYIDCWLDHNARFSGKSAARDFTDAERTKAVSSLADKLYQDLDILDAKSSGLISANAIISGIMSAVVIANFASSPNFFGEGMAKLCALLLLLSVLALALNISVLNLYWTTARAFRDERNIDDKARILLRVRNARTARYRFSLYLVLAILVVVLIVVLTMLIRMVDSG